MRNGFILKMGLFLWAFYFQLDLNILAQRNIRFDSYTQENGLPTNQIQCIFQDSDGWIWVGSNQGISQFDGYSFKNYIESETDSFSLKGKVVRTIFEDSKGNLLVGTEKGGLNVFDRELEHFNHPFMHHKLFNQGNISINDIEEDDQGTLWLATDHNIICINTSGDVNLVELKEGEEEYVRVIKFDNTGNLWAGTNNGLYKVDAISKQVKYFNIPFKTDETDEICELFLNDDGNIWIGSYLNGLFIVNPVTNQIESLALKPIFERSFTVRSVAVDDNGNYWIGTRAGIYVYNKIKKTTLVYRHDDRESTSLNNNSVLDIYHDKQGKFWIATRGGLNLIEKSKQVFYNYYAYPSDKNNRYLNSEIVHAFYADKQGNIWIGTEDGGINVLNPHTNTYQYIMANKSVPSKSISINCIKAFQIDDDNNLWIGTFLGGINVLNLKTGKIRHFFHDQEDSGSLSDNRVWDILMDKNHHIWIATSAGVDRYDNDSGKFVRYTQLVNNELVNWIEEDSNGNIWIGANSHLIIFNPKTNTIDRFKESSRYFLEDDKGRYWIATSNKGLCQYSRYEGAIRYYNTHDGLCNNQTLTILEDDDHHLWIGTNNGLSRFDPETGVFRNFSSESGLRNDQLTYGAAYKLNNGELIFGGIDGFNIFNPGEVKVDTIKYPMVFTELRVFNKKVNISNNENSILKKSILQTKHLIFNESQNVFTLEFAELNYANSEEILYSYYLEGFDIDWSEPGKNRSVTYTNLDPDDYVFHVKSIVPGYAGDRVDLTMKITVLPPFWKTIWFRLVVLAIIGALLYWLIRFSVFKEKIKNEVVIERIRSKKQRELETMKLKFFTNISHEIRTPLTLIIAPLEKILTHQMSWDELRSHLLLMKKNTNTLNRLVNQLLDFRKLESGNLKLELSQGEIVSFVSEVVNSFKSYAEEKEINLQFNSLIKSLVVDFDGDKLEKILNNLLSNAFKYTDKQGIVVVNLALVFNSCKDLSLEGEDKECIEITVRDTGRGISKKNTQKIFNRFFQSVEKGDKAGVGIGLSYTKELVELHKGRIFVESKPGKGSKFTIQIPYETVVDEEFCKDVQPFQGFSNKDVAFNVSGVKKSIDDKLKIILIVEDNSDVRMLVKSHFSSKYKVLEACDGKQGWEKAVEAIPDIVISDVLMPDVDGFEFCKKLKNDERTSHIPIVLLTALHSKNHELEGLTMGADDYITKPFDLGILQTKIDNIITIRQSIKEKYSEEITLQPKNIVITSPDEKFLQKAIECVENNISNPDLDIESFTKEVGISRMQLYRKLHALTDMTVKEFIRHIRLKRAVQLILQENLNINEIAFAVGFKDVAHFRKCFRKMYGMNPTEYKEKKKDIEHLAAN